MGVSTPGKVPGSEIVVRDMAKYDMMCTTDGIEKAAGWLGVVCFFSAALDIPRTNSDHLEIWHGRSAC